MVDAKEIEEALRFAVDLMSYNLVEAEPHETFTDLGNQVSELECEGCAAKGQKRWPGWEKEFEHEPNCRYLKFLATLNSLGIKYPKYS